MSSRPTRIHLCGRLTVELAGDRIEDSLPGRQGRLLFAYLALNRDRAVRRDELLDVLWPEEGPPPSGDSLLAPPLSRLRKALGAGRLEGRERAPAPPGRGSLGRLGGGRTKPPGRREPRSGRRTGAPRLDRRPGGARDSRPRAPARPDRDLDRRRAAWSWRTCASRRSSSWPEAASASARASWREPSRPHGRPWSRLRFGSPPGWRSSTPSVPEATRPRRCGPTKTFASCCGKSSGPPPGPRSRASTSGFSPATGSRRAALERRRCSRRAPAQCHHASRTGSRRRPPPRGSAARGSWSGCRAELESAAEGRTGLALLTGEGASARRASLAELAAGADGFTVLYGRCDEEELVPFGPWIEMLGGYLSGVPDDALQPLVGESGPEITRLLPELRARMPELREPPATDPETERQRLFSAVGAVIMHLAAQSPLLLMIDDLHWADRSSLLLARRLAQADSSRPGAHARHLSRHRALRTPSPVTGPRRSRARASRSSASGCSACGTRRSRSLWEHTARASRPTPSAPSTRRPTATPCSSSSSCAISRRRARAGVRRAASGSPRACAT